MLDFFFENQGTSTYLVYKIKNEDVMDTMGLGMVTNNKIMGIAPTIFTQMDDAKFLKYNITSKISLKQFFERSVNKKKLISVFNGIIDAIRNAEDYMIELNTILLDLEYIFVDVSKYSVALVCLPITNEAKNIDLAMFFKNIMFSTQFDQSENCDYVAKIISFINGNQVLALKDFKDLLISLDSQSGQKQQEQPRPMPAQPQSAQPVTPAPQPQIQPQVQVQAQTQINPQPAPQVRAPQQVQKAPQTPVAQSSSSVSTGRQSFSVPGASPATPKASEKTPASDEKKMTLFNLLMHYSKENKEIYDSQKAASKNATNVEAVKKTKSAEPKPAKGAKKANTVFAIPGQQPQAINDINNSAPNVKAVSATSSPSVQPVAQPQAPQTVAPAYQAPVMPQGVSASFGETTVLGGGMNSGETTVLNAVNVGSAPARPYLVRVKNQERVYLNDSVFKIGKEKSYVDYFIGDNTAISRSHANIVCRNGEYYIVDQNSTNHTYVNGSMIQSNVETKLEHDAKIRLANEEFEFKMY